MIVTAFCSYHANEVGGIITIEIHGNAPFHLIVDTHLARQLANGELASAIF